MSNMTRGPERVWVLGSVPFEGLSGGAASGSDTDIEILRYWARRDLKVDVGNFGE